MTDFGQGIESTSKLNSDRIIGDPPRRPLDLARLSLDVTGVKA